MCFSAIKYLSLYICLSAGLFDHLLGLIFLIFSFRSPSYPSVCSAPKTKQDYWELSILMYQISPPPTIFRDKCYTKYYTTLHITSTLRNTFHTTVNNKFHFAFRTQTRLHFGLVPQSRLFPSLPFAFFHFRTRNVKTKGPKGRNSLIAISKESFFISPLFPPPSTRPSNWRKECTEYAEYV